MALAFVVSVISVNGLLCLLAPGVALVLDRQSLSSGSTLALVALILIIGVIQLVAMWMALGPRLLQLWTLRNTRHRIDRILGAGPIAIAFQPIYSLESSSVVGVEALARFPPAAGRSPDAWFDDAERVGKGLDLELHAVRSALLLVGQLPQRVFVSLNVSPTTLASDTFVSTLLSSGVPPDRIVVEITEHRAVPDYTALRCVRAHLAEAGVRLAIDDAGAGFASFRHIVELSPDIIKLDRSLVSGVDHDAALRNLVRAVVDFAAPSSAAVVAEGVESLLELKALEALGVDMIQGFILRRPSTDPADWVTWRALDPIVHVVPEADDGGSLRAIGSSTAGISRRQAETGGRRGG